MLNVYVRPPLLAWTMSYRDEGITRCGFSDAYLVLQGREKAGGSGAVRI
jgi:hypothetical protein